MASSEPQKITYEHPFGTSFLETAALIQTVWFNNHQRQRHEYASTNKGFIIKRTPGGDKILVKLSE